MPLASLPWSRQARETAPRCVRFLDDENVPLPSVRLLREAGMDIEAVAEFAPGAPDLQVLTDAASGD